MRAQSITLTGVIFSIAAAITPAAQANIPAERLTGESTTSSYFPTSVLIGTPQLTRIRPTIPKQWAPTPTSTRRVSTVWAISPQFAPNVPQIAEQPNPTGLPAIASSPLTRDSELDISLTSEVSDNRVEKITSVTNRTDTQVAQALPSLESIQQIQRDLREIDIPEPARRRRSVYPGITISNPSGYGADKGQIFAGFGFQSRTRFSGGSNPGTVFGGGRRDGTAGIGFGLGDARKSVGVQLSYTAASFGGSRAPFSGGFNAKVHKQFGRGWAAAVGGEGIINFGRLPEDNDEIEFNDFEGTYYGVATKTIPLRKDFYKPFSRLTLTGGAGSGRFRSADQITNGEFGVGVFGSAALQVLPSTSFITEWTGQDLAVGLSVAPFPNFPIVLIPAIRDIIGESDGDPRFILGVGFSISDIFSKLGL